MKKISKFLGLFAALLLTVSVIAQKPVILDKVESHILTASQSKFKYKINVILPSGYQKKDSLHYPVLYALDGQYATTTFYALKETIGLAKELKDVIIVTIDRDVNSHNALFCLFKIVYFFSFTSSTFCPFSITSIFTPFSNLNCKSRPLI